MAFKFKAKYGNYIGGKFVDPVDGTLPARFWADAPKAVDCGSEYACPGASVLTSPRGVASQKRA